MVVGAFESVDLGGGRTAQLYLLRFDEHGRCLSPRSSEEFLRAAGAASDVFCFSHGWNNTFEVALDRYRSFIRGYAGQRATFHLAEPADYRPVLLGVIWPSTSFVMPWEAGPQIAAAEPGSPADRAREEMLHLVRGGLGVDAEAEFTELVDGRSELQPDEARRAAELVHEALPAGRDAEAGQAPPTPAELLEAWQRLDAAAGGSPAGAGRADDAGVEDDGEEDFGTIDRPAGAGPAIAGFSLDPRNLLRAVTLWTMKQRAGVVGVNGVGPILRGVLAGGAARLHLVGHSFGARVVLSALASQAPARAAHTVLLLQPAVNRWCFAENVAGTGRRGGYADVPSRVEQPVFTTMSSLDAPLHTYFHLALRGSHLGEPQIAALGDPELYGALGGYGPAGLGAAAVTRPAVGAGHGRYPIEPGVQVVAIDGATTIDGHPAISDHGDISNATTWWALHCLTTPI
jgi:hypothetical protein